MSPAYSRKLSSGQRWYYSGQHLGTRYFSRAIYHTKQECRRAEADRIKEIDERARHPEEIDMTLIELIDDRLDWIELKKSKKYYSENVLYFRRFVDKIGEDTMVSTITKSAVNSFIMQEAKRYKERGKTNHKVNAIIRLLKALFNYAIAVKDIQMKNPCVGLSFYPIKVSLKYIPNDEDIEAVKAICNDEQKLLIDFCMQTGCRCGEALRLKPKDIDEEYVVLWTRKAKNSDITPRRIPRPECLPDNFKGFSWVPEDVPSFLDRKVKKLKQRKWSWHSLRHRACSLWMKQGMSLYEIMIRLGHHNISTTQKYCQMIGGFTRF